MVRYSLKAVNSLLSPIQKNQGCPTFNSLWHLSLAFYDYLRKLDHEYHPTDGWAGYLKTKEEFSLKSTTAWTGPEMIWKYFVMPTRAIITGDQEQAKGGYKYKKDISDSYAVILMALKATFKSVIDKAYHNTGNTRIMGGGFGGTNPIQDPPTPPKDIWVSKHTRNWSKTTPPKQSEGQKPPSWSDDKGNRGRTMIPTSQPRRQHGTDRRATMHSWTDKAIKNRGTICKHHWKVEPQVQDHPPTIDGVQNALYWRLWENACRKWRNNNGTRGIWNRWHIQCYRWRWVIISREHSIICREGHTSRSKSEGVREQASSTWNGTSPDTKTDGILCTPNGICHDSRWKTPPNFRPDPTNISTTE